MSEGLTALLGCVQSEVSQLDASGKPQVYQHRLTERVVLPTPPDGTHYVAVTCKYCQQALRVQVQSRSSIRRKRLTTQLALGVSVCLWVAAAALMLVYFLNQYPATPGREVVVAGFLVVLGSIVWGRVDGYAAFAGDVAIGCKIERAPEEKAWSKQVSREVLRTMPRHVLVDPEYEPVSTGVSRESARASAAARRKPSLGTVAASSVADGATPSRASRIA
jgi:hypothetical protein